MGKVSNERIAEILAEQNTNQKVFQATMVSELKNLKKTADDTNERARYTNGKVAENLLAISKLKIAHENCNASKNFKLKEKQLPAMRANLIAAISVIIAFGTIITTIILS